MPGRTITVLAADGQPLYLEALSRIVHQDVRLALVAEATDGRGALTAIARHRPDVALIAASLPRLSGERVLSSVVHDRLATRVLLLTATAQPELAYGWLGRGAAGCLTRAAKTEHVREAIFTVARGGTYLGSDIQSVLAQEIRGRSYRERPLLSGREEQILRRIAEGHSAPVIARELQIAEATVKTHLGHLYEKLEVSERAAAVASALRRGLIE